jgi:hypothetical protein
MRAHLLPLRGLALAALAAALVWALTPADEASTLLRVGLVALLTALAVAALTTSVHAKDR